MAFVHGAAPWLRSLKNETTFDINLRISAYSKLFGSDHNRITLELASSEASAVVFISTCGDVFKKTLSADNAAELDSVFLTNVAADDICFPMFRFTSERFLMGKRVLNTSMVSAVAFAGANDCSSGTRLIDECFMTCKNALTYIISQLSYQHVTGGFVALQKFCDSFAHDGCVEHRISATVTDKHFNRMKSTAEIPLTSSFFTHVPMTFTEIANTWASAKAVCRAQMLESKLSLDCMPHPASLDALIKSLSEHTSGIFGKKKASGLVLNVLAETSNKLQSAQKDSQPSSHTLIRRKSVGGTNIDLSSARSSISASETGRRKTTMRGSSRSIIGIAGIDLTSMHQTSSKSSQKHFTTSQARTSIELTKGLISKNAPKSRILKERKCSLKELDHDLAFDHQDISSAVILNSQKFMVLTAGTYLHCLEIEMGKQLRTETSLRKDMGANLRILQSFEDEQMIFLVMSNGRLFSIRERSRESERECEFREFETHIDNCNLCSLLVHRSWLNICGSEGNSNIDYVRFKLEMGSVIENSGHVLPLGLSSSVTAIQFHLFDPKNVFPFVLCGLCNSDIEIWGKNADDDLHLMQSLRNRTSGLGAINSICSMGRDIISTGHDGGYVHFWTIDISSNSASTLDRQFYISPGSEGLPRTFQTVSADKFPEDKHHTNSQLFVINEQFGDSAVMHAETGVLLHTFSLPSFSPSILHQFSGDFNKFVTFFEFCILFVQESSLIHLVFQLQYVSSGETPKTNKLAPSADAYRRKSRIQFNSDSPISPRGLSEDTIEGVNTAYTDIHKAHHGHSVDDAESLKDKLGKVEVLTASRGPSFPASIQISESDAPNSDEDCNHSWPSLDEQNISQLQQTSSELPKASGIMNQILSRRSCPEIQQQPMVSSFNSVETLNDTIGANGVNEVCAAQKIMRPLFLLPTKLDLQRLSQEKDCDQQANELLNHRSRNLRTHLETELQGREDCSFPEAKFASVTQRSLLEPRTTKRSNLPKRMPFSHVHHVADMRKDPEVANRFDTTNASGSYCGSSISKCLANNTETHEIPNVLVHDRRPNPLPANDQLASSISSGRSGHLEYSFAASSSTSTEYPQDSSSCTMQPWVRPPLRSGHQSLSLSFNDTLNVHSGSRLPKRLQ